VQKSLFSTAHVPPHLRFDVWKESIATIFDVERPYASNDDDFDASLGSFLIGDQVMFSRCETRAQRFERSPLKVARDNLDYYLIQTHLSGRQSIRRASREAEAGPGDLLIIDLADAHSAMTTDFVNLSIVVPRRLLAPLLQQPDSQSGRVLPRDHALTSLVVKHLHTLAGLVPVMSPEEAGKTIEPTINLLAAALNSNADATPVDGGSVAMSLLMRAKVEIEKNLHENFSVEGLCYKLGISRASLYRLFEPLGGVRAYVQECRLRRCAEAIMAPQRTNRHIYEIAYRWGFSNEAHFSRAFKRRFGVSPSQARHELLQMGRDRLDFDNLRVGDRRYEQWLAQTLRF
jgi:AraC-like DNA-binding protein